MPLVKSGTLRRAQKRKVANKESSLDALTSRVHTEVALVNNQKKRANKELWQNYVNPMNYSLAKRGVGRTADSRKPIMKKILSKYAPKGEPTILGEIAAQRARSKTAAQLLKTRKQLRKAGWKPRPRLP